MQILDMTELTWTDSYNAGAAAYQAPSVVTEYYASNTRYPPWGDPKLAEIFQNSATHTPSPSPTQTPPSSHGSHTGVIVGAVVGGIAFLILVAGSLYWWNNRRQRQEYTPAAGAPPLPEMSEEGVEWMEMPAGNAPTELPVYNEPQELQTQEHLRSGIIQR